MEEDDVFRIDYYRFSQSIFLDYKNVINRYDFEFEKTLGNFGRVWDYRFSKSNFIDFQIRYRFITNFINRYHFELKKTEEAS